jgi:alanine racemase
VRATWAEIDLDAVEHNVANLRALAAPAAMCVVVKADGYGHGAAEVSRAALAAGADQLAVALVEEGAALREAGIDAPVLVLSEPPGDAFGDLVALGLEPTLYSEPAVHAVADAVAAAAAARTRPVPLGVHLKVDTGMHRVGAQPADAVAVAKAITARPELALASVWTHCAVADAPDDPFTAEQLRRFEASLAMLGDAGIDPPLRHAANSAAAIAHPAARYDMVRCGIAVYGVDPSPELAGMVDLEPALRLVSHVALVKEVAAGEALSYGQRYRLHHPSVVATVPIGYADGVRRDLSALGGEVLIRGRRRPIAGTVTMDQITVDCGDDRAVAPGDEVVLIGAQGGDRITAADWAVRLGTIGYEVVCGIGPRVPRRHLRTGR